MSLNYLRDDYHKQVVTHIRESRQFESMYILQGKTRPTCHTLSTLSRIWSTIIRISRGPHIATFHTVVNRFEQIHCTREEGLPTQSTAHRPSDPRVHTQLLSHNSQWSSGEKLSFCWQPTTRLTRPISPACDQYIQYLLAGANRTILNRHRRGLQLWMCQLATYPLPDLPNQLSPLSPSAPAWSPV
jgi:hypothetical protein